MLAIIQTSRLAHSLPAPPGISSVAFRIATCSTRRYPKQQCGRTSDVRNKTTNVHCHHGPPLPSVLTRSFWKHADAWRRASVNTFRCLVGCTSGDFSSMWFLQAFYPGLGVGVIMGTSMVAGISTSLLLETLFLRFGKDKLQLRQAVRMAAGMSLVSMLSMEVAENFVDYSMTGGVVNVADPFFWVSAGVSMGAGFLAPLPYNYFMLRKYGKACH